MQTTSQARKKKAIRLWEVILLYFGIALGSLLALSWYIQIVNADISHNANMAPERFVLFAPFFAVPSLLVALLAEFTIFRGFKEFRWQSAWVFLGVAYGTFWSCYGLVSFVQAPLHSVLLGVVVSLGGALAVHIVARLLARRVGD